MKQHRGYIHVYSEPGNGTEVKLHFPIEAAVAPEAGAPAEPYQASLPVGSETILLVEDEAAIRRTAARALTGQGYAVLQAADGEEALDLFRRHESAIALVISDLMMPKMGGRELYEALRHRRKRVRFLFTTGYAAADLATESLWALGQGVLHKPWTLGELLGRVREVLDRPPGR
jgi:DNA-binding response OmpR family regulator